MPDAIVGPTSVSAAVSAVDLPPMDAGLRRRAEQWAFTTQAIRATPFVTVWGPDEEFATRLDHLRALPPRRLATPGVGSSRTDWCSVATTPST